MGTRDTEEQLEVAKAEMVRLETENARLEAVIAQWERNYPCDGGCNYIEGPMEECSRDGRRPSEVWEIAREQSERANRAEARITAALDLYKPVPGLGIGKSRWRNADQFLVAIRNALTEGNPNG